MNAPVNDSRSKPCEYAPSAETDKGPFLPLSFLSRTEQTWCTVGRTDRHSLLGDASRGALMKRELLNPAANQLFCFGNARAR